MLTLARLCAQMCYAVSKRVKTDMPAQRRNQDVKTGRFVAGNRAAVAARGTPKKKLLSDQLREGLEKVDGSTGLPLYQLVAATLVDLAVSGSLDAIKEIFDRVEGKPRIAIGISEPIPCRQITRDMTLDEAARLYAEHLHPDDYVWNEPEETEPPELSDDEQAEIDNIVNLRAEGR